MQASELKSLVESGQYKPDPARVAVAMLRRRAVRELLLPNLSAADRVDQSRASSGFRPRAA
jgi:hypothetical protein